MASASTLRWLSEVLANRSPKGGLHPLPFQKESGIVSVQHEQPKPMKNHPSIESFLTLAEEIQDLQKAKDLLLSVWLADRREGRLPLELLRKLDAYFELDEDE